MGGVELTLFQSPLLMCFAGPTSRNRERSSCADLRQLKLSSLQVYGKGTLKVGKSLSHGAHNRMSVMGGNSRASVLDTSRLGTLHSGSRQSMMVSPIASPRGSRVG